MYPETLESQWQTSMGDNRAGEREDTALRARFGMRCSLVGAAL